MPHAAAAPMSGAPRTAMVLIAMQMSSTHLSSISSKEKGSLR
jgi:hypothetical protein